MWREDDVGGTVAACVCLERVPDNRGRWASWRWWIDSGMGNYIGLAIDAWGFRFPELKRAGDWKDLSRTLPCSKVQNIQSPWDSETIRAVTSYCTDNLILLLLINSVILLQTSLTRYFNMEFWDMLVALSPLFMVISILHLQYEVCPKSRYLGVKLINLQTWSLRKRLDKLENGTQDLKHQTRP